ncbi:MAG: glutamate--tRNA ligase [Oscillospiraceae bacterium]|jgi:glutamyl-tRNA synthetase|nr:glutamate--tRNA ligase [Oscillospiraceae bacterium]
MPNNKNAVDLAAALFPNRTSTVEELETRYPPRLLPDGAVVTRFAPSPTGYLHMGGLFCAFCDRLTASKANGLFFLRIDDTDQKRKVEGGVAAIVDGLRLFGIVPNEGVMSESEEIGAYGPYTQSKRKEIYHAVAKRLVERGLAYPCFCSPKSLDELRGAQEAANVNKGYYGTWARCRDLTVDEQIARIRAGEAFTLRFRADGDETKKYVVNDLIRGKLEMPENIMNVVLLKTDGIPTYHFAHVVDEHFMRVTHVIRGDEWLASLPLHIALFRACGFKMPKYAHTATLMKEDNGGKRKISKRKDPEAAVSYFLEQGYPAPAVLEYLLTLLNSGFEDWRRANPDVPLLQYPFQLKNLSSSGALFDWAKLGDVSKNVLARMDAAALLRFALDWSKTYDPALFALLSRDEHYAESVLRIDRGGAKPRKDIAKLTQLKAYLAYFYDDLFEPAVIPHADGKAILEAYADVFNPEDSKDAWFAAIKTMCASLGFAPNTKEYKQSPADYKGHVGDVTTVIRLAVTGRENTPDLWAIMQVLGGVRTRQRMAQTLCRLG